MILDAKTLFADALAHGGTPTVVDLGSENAGKGNTPMLVIKGTGLAGATGFTVKHGTTSGGATTLLETVIASAAALNAGVSYKLPSNVNRYVALALTGTTSAGTWTAALQTEGGQTNL